MGCAVGRERSWGARLGAGSGHAREARQRQHGSWLECLGDEPEWGITTRCGSGFAIWRPRLAAHHAPGCRKPRSALATFRLGRAGLPYRARFRHADEQPVPELQVARVPVDDRLEVDDHRLVDADGVRPAAADGLQRRRVCEVPRAARRLRARRREASPGGARWPRLSWGGTVIAGDGLKARWPGDGGATS